MEQRKKEFNYTYDIIRILAVFTVVIGHATYTTWSGDGGLIELNLDQASETYHLLHNRISRLGGWIYGFHMPLFFMLSGAVYSFSSKRDNFDIFMNGKIRRLIIPYFLVGLFYMIPIKYISGFYTKDAIASVIQGFLFGQFSGHLWFLLALFWCFAIFYGLEKYIFTKSCFVAVIVACAFFNFNQYSMINSQFLSVIPGLTRAISYLPYFIGGFLFERLLRQKTENIKAIVIIFTISLVLNILQMRKGVFTADALKVILGSSLMYSIAALLSRWNGLMKNKGFEILRRDAFDIYLFHEPINFIVLRMAINTKMIESMRGGVTFFAMRIFGAITISVILAEMLRYVKTLVKNRKKEENTR